MPRDLLGREVEAARFDALFLKYENGDDTL